MKISDAGLELIKGFEGCKLDAYQDGGGVWTLGFGHTQGIKEGLSCTQQMADDWLKQDVHRAENCLDKSVTADLTQGEYDALCSFIFNVGCGAFLGSTLLRFLNEGRMDDASLEFKRWNKDNGIVVAGLTKRREAEAALFTA